jgi:hypothetical protein
MPKGNFRMLNPFPDEHGKELMQALYQLLSCHVHSSFLPDYGHLDLSGILHFLLNFIGDFKA